MNQIEIPAAFYRGGTSKGVFFHEKDLPEDQARRDEIFLQVIGTPDPYRRQLNGMGGGISSLSKVITVGPPTKDSADVDYTFGQVALEKPVVDYATNCGNLSSAIAPFAIDEGLVTPDLTDGTATVRLHNTNTGVIIHAQTPVTNSKAAVTGDFEIQGVYGTGARIRLDYLEPGGATTGKFLPAGEIISSLNVEEVGKVDVSLVDATTGMVFIDASNVGLSATESPEAIEGDADMMARLDAIRRSAGVCMGIANSVEDVPLTNPRIGLLAGPSEFTALDGSRLAPDEQDITVRILSLNNVHRVSPLTSALCLAAASRIEGSIPNKLARQTNGNLRVGTPSGVLPVNAVVTYKGGEWRAISTTSYRTARRLMQGCVLIPKA